MTERPESRFYLYCHADGTCSLKRDGDEAPPQTCAGLVDAIHLAHELKGAGHMHVTVYDPTGAVLLQSFA